MNTRKSITWTILVLPSVMIIATLACNLPIREEPDTRATMNAALTEVYETSLPLIVQDSVTQSPEQPTQTPQPGDTVTSTLELPKPSETETSPLPTAASVEQDVFASDLQRRGYGLIASSSIIGPKDFVYSAFLFNNTKIDPSQGETNPEICRLAVYRLDEDQNSLLRSFTAPPYPEGSRYTYPVSCEAVNWDSPSPEITWGGEITPEIRALLGLNGFWSDINQNGLPEFAVNFQYCNQGCVDYGAVAVHFYEITNTYQPVDITAELPGVLQPWNIVHNRDPLDIWVYGPIEYEANLLVDASWIYAWGETGYGDVTAQHAGDYKAQIDQRVQNVQNRYGMAITSADDELLEILVLSNRAGLSNQQTLNTFLEITNPVHWPGTDQTLNCWLNLARVYAQRAVDANRPFSLPPSPTTINGTTFSDILETIDQDRYDVSACK